MAAYTEFYDYVSPECPRAPDDQIKLKIRSAVMDFCERTRRYKYDVAPISIVAAQHTYGVAVPSERIMVDVLSAFVNKIEIYPRSTRQLDEELREWRTATGAAVYYYVPDQNQIRIVRIPTEAIANGLELTVALKPARISEDCPDWILEDHAETIAHGALARLFSMRGVPWSDPQMAGAHESRFNTAIGQEALASLKSDTQAPIAVGTVY